MKPIFCVFVAFLLFNTVNAQCDTTLFRYSGLDIQDISLIDTNIVVGVTGSYIVKSTDGGKNWKIKQTQQSNLLLAIQLPTDSVGYAVGDYKTILKTEDQGENWFPLYCAVTGYTNPYSDFKDLFFFNSSKGFIVGDDGKLVATNDGGKSWTDTTFNSSYTLTGITFINDSLGFICGNNSQLYRTKNGGRQWEQLNAYVAGSSITFNKVRFIDSTTGFVVGSGGTVLKTINGGTTWTKLTMPVSGVYYQDIYFMDSLKGFITGSSSNFPGILRTIDGGNTWNVSNPYPGKLGTYNAISADKNNKKIIFAGGGGGRYIVATTDAGATYQVHSFIKRAQFQFNSVHFVNDSTGYIGGEQGAVYRTADYGETWKPLQNIPGLNSNLVRTIFFVDSLHGFAVTDNIYKTVDGARTWTQTTIPGNFPQYTPRQMHFYDTLTGLVQDQGNMFKTIDGGTTWSSIATPNSFYRDFTATADGKAFAVGYNGKLIASIDKGTTWSTVNLNTTKYLTSIYFYNNQVGYIGTADTALFKTTDGGVTWAKLSIDIPSNFEVHSLRFLNDSAGYMTASNGSSLLWMYKTKNGGVSWQLERVESEKLSYFSGFSTLYIVGGGGIILKTDKSKLPTAPGYIYGPDKACINNKSAFITGSIPGVTYNWSLSGGGVDKPIANKDTVLWNAAGQYTLTMSVSNACGISQSRQTIIDVASFQPIITVVDSVLTATEGLTYQWYRSGIPISASQGGTSRSIIGRLAGSYTVQVKGYYGCTIVSPAVTYAGLSASLCPDGSTSISSYLGGSSYQWQRNTGLGFINISDNSFFTGTNTSTLLLTNIPSSWYGYTFRYITNMGTSDIYTLQFTNRWIGSIDTKWENPANWSCGTIPDANTDVVITSGTVVIQTNVSIRKLTMNPTVNLTVRTGNTLTITH